MSELRIRHGWNGGKIEADPFRREDVDYTTVSWVNPVTGDRQVWSLPVEFIVTFFEPENLQHRYDFDRERKRWLERAV